MEPRSCFRVAGSGVYLPRQCITSEELDRRLDRPRGWSEEKSKVKRRYYAEDDETFSYMAAEAARRALDEAKLDVGQIDFLISASATCEQPLPYQAAAVHRALGLGEHGTPCFDVGTTCLSFISALEVASLYITSGKYQRILIVSSEIPSIGLNWRDADSAPLFGDGAAAVVLEAASDKTSGLIAARLETYSVGYEHCNMRAGASRWNMRRPPESDDDYLFRMDGRKAFKLVSEKMERFIETLMRDARLRLSDLDMVIPHQASPLALTHIRQRLEIPSEKFTDILADHGNQVAASLPIALHHNLKNAHIGRGSTALLLGTSAGLSIGAAIVRF